MESDNMKNLAADIFVSLLILDRRMGGSRIRHLLRDGVIREIRELAEVSLPDIAGEFGESFGEEEIAGIGDCLLDPSLRKKAVELTQVCLSNHLFSVNQNDIGYPSMMKDLPGMPLVLFGKGDMRLAGGAKMPSVAVVGSRQPTLYGVTATEDITGELARHGVTIISGLARGIDTTAHETTLKYRGKTIAVMAGGLDMVYPPENRKLFDKIAESGLVLSEMPPGQPAIRQYFPARNRILSGLSDLVAIMEAGEQSGTLHTASFAAAQGRDVFVLPGTIYSEKSRGNLRLIQDGADILLSAEDILGRLAGQAFFREIDEIKKAERDKSIRSKLANCPDSLTREESMELITGRLSLCEQTMDELIHATGLKYSVVAPLLSELELSGKVIDRRQRYALTFQCP